MRKDVCGRNGRRRHPETLAGEPRDLTDPLLALTHTERQKLIVLLTTPSRTMGIRCDEDQRSSNLVKQPTNLPPAPTPSFPALLRPRPPRAPLVCRPPPIASHLRVPRMQRHHRLTSASTATEPDSSSASTTSPWDSSYSPSPSSSSPPFTAPRRTPGSRLAATTTTPASHCKHPPNPYLGYLSKR